MFHITNKGQSPEFNRDGREAEDKIIEQLRLNDSKLSEEAAQAIAENLMSDAEGEPGVEFENEQIVVEHYP